jgi:RNA polymerase sigma-70 factor (ECF subfamily)
VSRQIPSTPSGATLGAERSSRGVRLERVEFEQLFRECAADVHGYAISLLRDAAAAEDVTAIAFERVYRSRGRLDRRRGTPRAWLFAIARNAALDELRRRKRQPLDQVAPESARVDAASVEEIDRVERGAALQQALRALAPREREIVLLKFHGALNNGELARVLGISESNAGTRLHRALLKLRAQYATLGVEEVA